MPQSVGSQTVTHNLTTEQQQQHRVTVALVDHLHTSKKVAAKGCQPTVLLAEGSFKGSSEWETS